ncbi:hypothetical protein KM043_006718 [Ampulex compressa]|nr:hypothetical protein KM043_006718 [Ampulex compressa]
MAGREEIKADGIPPSLLHFLSRGLSSPDPTQTSSRSRNPAAQINAGDTQISTWLEPPFLRESIRVGFTVTPGAEREASPCFYAKAGVGHAGSAPRNATRSRGA